MKTTQKQRNESGKVQIALLVAVALAAGVAGVCSELQAAGATVTKANSGGLYAFGQLSGAYISENGDGTAYTDAIAYLEDGSILYGFDFANTAYSITANIEKGQSGNGTGAGTARASIDGGYRDPDSFELVTPALIELELAVAGATDVSAHVYHGVRVSTNPVAGESIVERVHQIGNTAVSYDAGAMTLSVDGTVVSEETGAFGAVFSYSTNSVVRLK